MSYHTVVLLVPSVGWSSTVFSALHHAPPATHRRTGGAHRVPSSGWGRSVEAFIVVVERHGDEGWSSCAIVFFMCRGTGEAFLVLGPGASAEGHALGGDLYCILSRVAGVRRCCTAAAPQLGDRQRNGFNDQEWVVMALLWTLSALRRRSIGGCSSHTSKARRAADRTG